MLESNVNLHKGIEKGSGCLTRLNKQGWNILAEEVSFPIAVIKEQALSNNALWMQNFSEQAKVKLAPHGKTTMAPDLFKLQIEQGCWGISLATVPQVISAYEQGISRIILANQLIGAYHFALMDSASDLSQERLFALAEDLDLDLDQFKDDMKAEEVGQEILSTRALAQRIGANGTPAFIVGTTSVPPNTSFEEFKALIQSIRAKKAS